MPECLPDLTIAIPVRNEERNLEVCLKAIDPDFVSRVVVRSIQPAPMPPPQ